MKPIDFLCSEIAIDCDFLVLCLVNPALSVTSIIPQSAFYPSLDDLSALLPKEILLLQPTLCKVATEEERDVELGRSGSSADPALGDSPIFEVHLRVLLKDFRSTSTAHFEVSAKKELAAAVYHHALIIIIEVDL